MREKVRTGVRVNNRAMCRVFSFGVGMAVWENQVGGMEQVGGGAGMVGDEVGGSSRRSL